MALLFENETCGRCGGTGKHSFNQIDGDRCYGCTLRSVKDDADRQAQVAAALAYQATLTKTGAPSKKAIKAQQVPA